MKTLLVTASIIIAWAAPFQQANAYDSVAPGTNAYASAPLITSTWAESLNTNVINNTTEPSEPGHAMNGTVAAGKSVWWRWQASETGFSTVSTRLLELVDNAVGRTSLAVYTGSSLATLQRVAANENWTTSSLAGASGYSQVTFYATAGTIYSIAVDGREAQDVNANRYQLAMEVRLAPLKKTVRTGIWSLTDNGGILTDAGTITLTTTEGGSFSGKLVSQTRTYPLKGAFGLDGTAWLNFERPKKDGVPQTPLSVMVSLVGGGELLILQDGYQAQGGLVEKAVFQNDAPVAGPYTAYHALSGGNSAAGYGSLSLTVKAKGQVRGTGVLPEGTPFTFSSYLMGDGGGNIHGVYVHVPQFQKKGFVQFYLTLQDNGAADEMTVYGILKRPAPKSATDPFYPQGINAGLLGSGGPWTVPASGERALGFLDPAGAGTLTVTNILNELPGGNLLEPLTLSTKNKFTFGSPARRPSLKLNAKTGLVTGSLTEVPLKPNTLRGVVVNVNGVPVLVGHVKARTLTLPVQVQ